MLWFFSIDFFLLMAYLISKNKNLEYSAISTEVQLLCIAVHLIFQFFSVFQVVNENISLGLFPWIGVLFDTKSAKLQLKL